MMRQSGDSRTSAAKVLATLKRNRLDISLYLAILVLSTFLGYAVLGFPGNFSRLPISYSGDGITMSSAAKNLVDHGTYYSNPSLGAPGTAEFYDAPSTDGALTLELVLLALLTRNWVLTLNLFCLLSYPLIAASSLWVMRRLGLSRAAAFVFSMLYAFLPFHQSRMPTHTYLAAYFSVPLAIAMIVELSKKPEAKVEGPSRRLRFLGLPLWCWLVAALLGASGIYYAYFTVVLVGVLALLTVYSRRRLRAIVPFVGVGGVILLVVVAQMIPSFTYWNRVGPNNLGDARVPWESDLYALRMTQLVFPMTGHRLPVFAHGKDLYRKQLAQISEKNLGIAYDSSLGIMGAFGFILLLVWMLGAPFRSPPDGPEGTPSILSIIGISAFLLGTVGGVGGIISVLGFPQIRAYDRITVFVGFAALAATGWLADWLIRRVRILHNEKTLAPSLLGLMCFAAVLAFGVWDTTSPTVTPNFSAFAPAYRSDGSFVQSVETVLPDGASVLQLPVIKFPEAPAINQMGAYDHLRMYLHSRSLRWSAGAYKGRPSAAWQAKAVALPAAEMLAEARKAGFAGVVVDRFGYSDAGRSIEASLSSSLGTDASRESPDGRYSFFDIR